jgi:serine/threonine protein phosphatase PrpC
VSREQLGLAIVLIGVIVLVIAVFRAITARRPEAHAEARPPRLAAKPAAKSEAKARSPRGTAPTPATRDSSPPPSSKGSASAQRSATPAAMPADPLPSLRDEEDDDDVTLITLRSHIDGSKGAMDLGADEEEDEDVAAATRAHPILFDEDAGTDEPTGPVALFLVSGAAATDRGKVRRRNEDAYFAEDQAGLYVVADGMGGYAGGDVASHLAVETMTEAFTTRNFGTTRWPGLPRRATELASAIELANGAVFARAREDARLRGMGTTVVSARFSPKKQRLYLGHVGDSRCYRVRSGKITAMTSDHTLASVGVGGPAGARLVRAVGIEKHVEIDLIIAKPAPGDVYLLCSDGLTKMAGEDEIAKRVAGESDPAKAAQALVDLAIEHGGKDNVTVVVVRVERALSGSSRPPPRKGPSVPAPPSQ